jgi:hypothetical protein
VPVPVPVPVCKRLSSPVSDSALLCSARDEGQGQSLVGASQL